ncbi:trypsin domain-containing protein [Ditylenchus destructor]|uniref:Trypsin domain-containing protein n=1 Tax=Ditylenchus destructor TaxID=166010 RepID=A0AAD4N484_9BILA|nr:trypsin domain-containing protein [Ditylenchus destructor]
MMVQLDGTCIPGSNPCPSKESETRPVGVKAIYVPKLYVETHCDKGDIAVIELNETIKERILHLAKTEKYPEIMFTSGYGFDPERAASAPDILMTANVTLKNCPNDEQNDDIICSEEIKQNACEGDSGAGLRDIDLNIYGVVSYGTSCSHMHGKIRESEYLNKSISKDTFKGGVFTKVGSYLPFICNITRLTEKEGCVPNNQSGQSYLMF